LPNATRTALLVAAVNDGPPKLAVCGAGGADDGRTRKGRSHPAAMIEDPVDDEQLVQRLAAITQLAEQLDRGTLDLALRIVPIEWWREQLGASATIPL
jgi:hypothetical protein